MKLKCTCSVISCNRKMALSLFHKCILLYMKLHKPQCNKTHCQDASQGAKNPSRIKKQKMVKRKKANFPLAHLSQLCEVWSWTSSCILTFAHFCSFRHLESLSGEGSLRVDLLRACDQQFGEATSQEHIDPTSRRPESAVRLHGAVGGAAFRGAVGLVKV